MLVEVEIDPADLGLGDSQLGNMIIPELHQILDRWERDELLLSMGENLTVESLHEAARRVVESITDIVERHEGTKLW